MSKLAENLDLLLTPLAERMTPELAQLLVSLKADPKLEGRLEELADRCTEGLLTPEERSEYEVYVTGIQFLAILKSKARLQLKKQPS